MKKNYYYSLIFVLLCIVLFSSETNAQASIASISIDHVDSLYNGKVQPDQPLKFHIRWTNNTGYSMKGSSNGFRFYLTNRGEIPNTNFNTIILDLDPLNTNELLEFQYVKEIFDTNGTGSDTVGFDAVALQDQIGIPIGFDDIIGSITTTISSDYAGDTLCIDSSFVSPVGVWKWATASGGSSFFPDWSGPHCYEILPSCCIGMRGNFNNSHDNQIDISDLVSLVSFMFLNGNSPTCDEEADFNGDGTLDIADLVDLVAYMHLGGDPPADCP